jgi:hypothetical protein
MMKTFATLAVQGMIWLIAGSLNPLHAQFFKDLLNSAKQTAQNRANDKTTQTTNAVLNKVDSSMQLKKKTRTSANTTQPANGQAMPMGIVDTSATRRVFGAFAQAAAANPNDTSSADVTMRALNIMVGGGGVSASDSAAAIKSFMTATGGSGMFYQYITTTSAKGRSFRDTSSTWLTVGGSGRKESRVNMPGAMSGKIIMIGHVNQPQYSMMLDPDKKTYSLTVIDTSLINAGGDTYQVTRLGNETVQGYSCTHSRLSTTTGSGMFKSTSTMDLWTSTAIPGYALYRKMNDMSNLKPKMMQALNDAGAGGFIVKMTAGNADYSMGMQLLVAETRNCPASLFEIPAGYSKSDETMMSRMLSGARK